MTVMVDTNVMLDIALKREPFLKSSALALSKARATGPTVLCATTMTTLHYFLSRQMGEARARQFMEGCLQAMPVAPVDQDVLQAALRSPMQDFEDGVIAHAAVASGAHTILTRDKKDFAHSPVPALSPDDYLSLP